MILQNVVSVLGETMEDVRIRLYGNLISVAVKPPVTVGLVLYLVHLGHIVVLNLIVLDLVVK